jgi:hypothetical protein
MGLALPVDAPMRSAALVAPLALLGPLLACGLDVVGSASDGHGDAGTAAQAVDPSAPSPSPGGSPSGSAPPGGTLDGRACPSLRDDAPTSPARTATASPSGKAKSLAGGAAQFSACPSVYVGGTVAARRKGTVSATATITLEWEPSALWVLADVLDPSPGQGSSDEVWRNDSLELYVSGTATRLASYGPADHHYAVDHRGVARDYSGGKDEPFADTGFEAVAGGYRIVFRIDAAALGGPLDASRSMAFDVLLNDGVDQANWLLWAMQPNTSCLSCTASSCLCGYPSNDPRLFAPLSLRDR